MPDVDQELVDEAIVASLAFDLNRFPAEIWKQPEEDIELLLDFRMARSDIGWRQGVMARLVARSQQEG